nr:protein YgfX [Stutzerimonas sp. S1]
MLLGLYLLVQSLALTAVVLSAAPLAVKICLVVLCFAHAAWVVPRSILFCSAAAWRGLRHDDGGWSLWSQRGGWQPIQLRPDSMALPFAVVLRFRLPGRCATRGLCIPRDALSVAQHRRLRVRLRFSRNRWAAPE